MNLHFSEFCANSLNSESYRILTVGGGLEISTVSDAGCGEKANESGHAGRPECSKLC